jgi:pimeloyl-ACP methyl ester carboxylesterase
MSQWGTEHVDLPGVRIAYRQAGRGPALLLLHGNSESKSIFARYQQVYFPMFHTLAIDSRGHGETVSRDEEYTIGQYADDVMAFCRMKGLTEACVIGYSDGGNIALHLAKKAPDIFTKLAAISPNYLASGITDGTLQAMRSAAKAFKFLGRLGLPTRKAVMRLNLMLNDIGITAEELAGIRTKVRILYAKHDLIKETHILEIGRLIPNAGIREMDGCNHITIFEKKETVADIVEFLQG